MTEYRFAGLRPTTRSIESLPIGRVLTLAQAAAKLGVSPVTLRKHYGDNLPEPDGYVGRTPCFHPDSVIEWLKYRNRDKGTA